MAKKKVIKADNERTKLPIWSSLIVFMALHQFNAPQWLYGALGLLFLSLWITAISEISKEEPTDVFKELNKTCEEKRLERTFLDVLKRAKP